MLANKIDTTFYNLKFSIISYNQTWNQNVPDTFYYYFTWKKIPFLLAVSAVSPSPQGGQVAKRGHAQTKHIPPTTQLQPQHTSGKRAGLLSISF